MWAQTTPHHSTGHILAVADPGGFHWFPRKPPLKNDCVTIKCFNYRGVRLDRDTVIEQSQ